MEVSKERNSLTTVAKKMSVKVMSAIAAEQKVTRQAYQTRVPLFVYQHSRGKFCEISALTTTAALPPKDGNLPHLRGDFR